MSADAGKERRAAASKLSTPTTSRWRRWRPREPEPEGTRMRRTTILPLAVPAVLGALALPALAAGGARSAATHTVVLKSFRFHPSTLTIRRGDSVRWLWEDNTEHNVTFHTQHSRTQEHGSYTVRFTRRGTFGYHCTIHVAEGMVGKILVR